MPKIQIKIMAALTLLVVVVVVASGFFAERGLRESTTAAIERNLEREAQLIAQLIAGLDFVEAERASFDPIIRRASTATGSRITLIDFDGWVIADSEVPPETVPALPNHGDRVEVRGAIETGRGRGIRRSDTVKRRLLYVAIRAGESGSRSRSGVVRLAVNLDEVDAAAAELRAELVAGGLIGLIGALALSYGLSVFSLRPIRELREVVTDVAAGKLERRLRWEGRDERGEIAQSINRLARQIRDNADQALREKVRLEAVLSSMVEGVIVLDRDDRILLANPRAQEMLSIWGDIDGKAIPEVSESPELDRALVDAAASDEIVVRELVVAHATKRRVLLMHATGFPKSGERAGTVAVFHDVTELRRVDEVRRDFIANASHELRTPLTAIQGFADTLGQSTLKTDDRARHLDAIIRNAQRMSNLIDDLLSLTRIESGTEVLDIRDVEVAPLVETILADFKPRFDEAGIEASFHAESASICRGDRSAIEQILSNLLTNAARYSNPNSAVDVTVKDVGDVVEILIEDTGIGIPEPDLERIFERFYRVDASRSRALGSTGLGLSIVRHLVRSMNGGIRVESVVGSGSRFYVTLPRA